MASDSPLRIVRGFFFDIQRFGPLLTLPDSDIAAFMRGCQLSALKGGAAIPGLSDYGRQVLEASDIIKDFEIPAIEEARQKSEMRANVGASGGKAKAEQVASKSLAIAKQEPINSKPIAQQTPSLVLNEASVKQGLDEIKQLSPGKPGKKVRTKIEDFPEDFQKAWAVCHPKSKERSGTADAFKAWESSGASQTPEKAIAAIAAVSKSHEWTKDGAQFAKGLGAWLRTGAWMSEISVKITQTGKKTDDYSGYQEI